MSLDQAELGAVRVVVREEIREALRELQLGAPPAPRELDPMLDIDGVVALVPNSTADAVRAWCRSGRLVAKKIGRGWVIKRSALDRFLSAISVVPDAPPAPDREASRILGKLRGST